MKLVLVPETHQALDLDPITLAAGRSFHSDEIVERCHGDREVLADHGSDGIHQ